ncbi:MAG: O-antigen ligase family protein [Candidatus Omnitrophota bacterium]
MLTILLILIFIRPFISSLAFPCLNSIYSALLLSFLIIWLAFKKTPLNKFKNLSYPLILFLLSVIISVIFSNDRLSSLKELYKYISALSLFLIAAALSWNDKTRVIRTLVLAGFVISLLAIYQSLFGFRHILDYIAQQRISDPFVLDYIARRRAFLPFVTPNILAGYLIMVIPLTTVYKKGLWLAVPLSIALLLTRSIGALLSLSLALGVYFFLLTRFKKRNAVLLLVISVIIALVFITRSYYAKEHLRPVFSALMRLNYWKDTLNIIARHPLAGIGIGNFTLVNSRYAHNSYLQIWAEMGILGALSFIWLFIAVFKAAVRNNKDWPAAGPMAGLFIANAAFLLHNLLDFSFYLPEVSFIWWIILGLLASSV